MREQHNYSSENLSKKGMYEALSLPELDVNELIRLGIDLALGETTIEDIVSGKIEKYGRAIKEYLNAYSENQIRRILEESQFEGLNRMADGDFPEKLKCFGLNVADLIRLYVKGDLNAAQFVCSIASSDGPDLARAFLKGCGIDERVFVDETGAFRKLSSPVIGFCAATKAYEVLMKALDDAESALEHRKIIEEQCRKSVEQIKQYRHEMEQVVSKYMQEHLETINRSFAMMDKALLEGDTDGYIRSNAELQQMLGYQMQFSNQQEFDDLMESDVSLKL